MAHLAGIETHSRPMETPHRHATPVLSPIRSTGPVSAWKPVSQADLTPTRTALICAASARFARRRRLLGRWYLTMPDLFESPA
jgi:hypothetical protein